MTDDTATETMDKDKSGAETLGFQAEVARLLHLMVHSVYSEKEIFLRELISNASDACDRLRYAALTDSSLMEGEADLRVTIAIDKKAKTLTITDNGIGMSRDELAKDLGTIARSGSGAFVENLTGDDAKDVSLIGQFGIGFYAAFMVADKVEVISRRAGSDEAWSWESDGLGEFTLATASREGRGTTIHLHLRKDAKDYLDDVRLRQIVKTYSDHVALPIVLLGAKDGEDETLNTASALWVRPKKEITGEQYTEFYHHVGHVFDEPWVNIHYKAEGKIEYSVLLFVPTQRPYDLFDPERKCRVKLYVRRVYITDDCDDLLPPYLRFMRGVVDSEDLPLNVSREMLQNNPVITRMRQAITKRILSTLEKKAEKDADGYSTFWDGFGAVLKEGIYEDHDLRERLLKLARFRSTKSGDGTVSFDGYLANMAEGQDAIYYITGDDLEALRRSPQLEGFAARDIEVLLLTDPVDDFWIPAVAEYEGKALKSATRAGEDLEGIAKGKEDAKDDKEKKDDKDSEVADTAVGTLIALLKETLGESVKDVRTSSRLTDSAVCLVADEGDMDMHLERMLKKHQQQRSEVGLDTPRILEINPKHELIATLAKAAGKKGAMDDMEDACWLLLDQARIVEGEPPADPAVFAKRLAKVMSLGVAK